MAEILKVPTTIPPEKQKDMWQELLSFWSWYPDLFLDAVTPKIS